MREGARILVTGGASGLGAAVASAVTDAGASAYVLDRQAPVPRFPWEQVDLADGRATEKAVQRVAESGGLDGVVTAAGTDACGDLDDVPAQDWERVVRVNLLGTAAVVRAAAPWLEQRGGRLVLVGSTLGLRALPAATAYCASKFGVVGFARALTAELSGRVGVTLLQPGGMDTAFFDGRPEQFKPAADQPLAAPADVAAAALFALEQPPGSEIKELVIAPPSEPSWP